MNETRPGGPTVLRMILGRQLQALREKAGMSFDDAAAVIYTSSATVRRIERAEGALKPLNVKSLLMAYGITDVREIDAFLALARDASKPGWWHSYDDVLPAWFRTLIGLEGAASLIRGFDPHSVPGLLQAPGYALADVQTGFPDAAEEEVARRVDLRLARQHILTRPDPPRLWLVIDETVLTRPVATAGPEVMREQVDKLIEAAGRPNITLQVLPLAAGLHPAAYGPFRIFRFDFDGHEQQGDRPGEVDQLTQRGVGEDRGGVAQVGQHDARGAAAGEQRVRVDVDDRVVVHVDDPGIGRDPSRDLVHVACGRDAGADVDELPNSRLGGQEPHRPPEKDPVGQRHRGNLREVAQDLPDRRAVGGVIVVPAEVGVVHPSRVRLARVDLRSGETGLHRILPVT